MPDVCFDFDKYNIRDMAIICIAEVECFVVNNLKLKSIFLFFVKTTQYLN